MFSELISSFSGAFAGALGAQYIIERSTEQKLSLLQLRNTNATITLAYSICDSIIALKDQYVADLYATFENQKKEYLNFKEERNKRTISPETEFFFQADLRILPMPLVPIDTLQTQLFEKLSITGRPLLIAVKLSETIASLTSSIANRNYLIERFRTTGGAENPEFPYYYFGLKLSSGKHSTEYPDTVKAIHSLTDYAIFFSHLLCLDLQNHGETICQSYKTKFKDNSQSVHKVDFSKAKERDLLPNEENYKEYLCEFSA